MLLCLLYVCVCVCVCVCVSASVSVICFLLVRESNTGYYLDDTVLFECENNLI